MKKIVILTMLGILTLTGSLSANECRPMPLPESGLVISLKIIFHRPKFDCQRGFGICLLWSCTWGESKVGSDETYCIAKGSVNERNQLVVQVEEGALTKYENGSALPYFRDKTSISILDPYALPEETCRALGVKPPLTIKPGNYPVSFENGVYTVVFQL